MKELNSYIPADKYSVVPTAVFRIFFCKGKSRSSVCVCVYMYVCVNKPPQCEHRAVFVWSTELSPAGPLLCPLAPSLPAVVSIQDSLANTSHVSPSHASLSQQPESVAQARARPAELVSSVSLLSVHYSLISLALCPIRQQKWESLFAPPLPFCTCCVLRSALRSRSNGRCSEVRTRLLMNPFNYRSSVVSR